MCIEEKIRVPVYELYTRQRPSNGKQGTNLAVLQWYLYDTWFSYLLVIHIFINYRKPLCCNFFKTVNIIHVVIIIYRLLCHKDFISTIIPSCISILVNDGIVCILFQACVRECCNECENVCVYVLICLRYLVHLLALTAL